MDLEYVGNNQFQIVNSMGKLATESVSTSTTALSGGGSANFVAKYNSSGVLTNSAIYSDTTGKVGIGTGTSTPGHLLTLSGGAYCDGTGAWISGSDRAFKTDIQDMAKYGLNAVMSLRPVTYVHKADTRGRVQIGFIAQEVKQVTPEVVEGEEGSMGMAYDRLVPVLVNAIKELKTENDVMKARNVELMHRLEALETKLK